MTGKSCVHVQGKYYLEHFDEISILVIDHKTNDIRQFTKEKKTSYVLHLFSFYIPKIITFTYTNECKFSLKKRQKCCLLNSFTLEVAKQLKPSGILCIILNI
jgi:hypothetical protein